MSMDPEVTFGVNVDRDKIVHSYKPVPCFRPEYGCEVLFRWHQHEDGTCGHDYLHCQSYCGIALQSDTIDVVYCLSCFLCGFSYQAA